MAEGIVAMEDISEGIRIGRAKVTGLDVEIPVDNDRRILIMATRAEMRGNPTLFLGADGTLKIMTGAMQTLEEDRCRAPRDQKPLLEEETTQAQHPLDDVGTGTTPQRHLGDENDHGRARGLQRHLEIDVLLPGSGDLRRMSGRGGGRKMSAQGEKGWSFLLSESFTWLTNAFFLLSIAASPLLAAQLEITPQHLRRLAGNARVRHLAARDQRSLLRRRIVIHSTRNVWNRGKRSVEKLVMGQRKFALLQLYDMNMCLFDLPCIAIMN